MLIPFALSLALAGPVADSVLERTLRAKDQALMDAFAPGDRAVWASAMAPDAVYLDENNVLMTRAAFLAQLRPLPPNTSGHIAIVKYTMRRAGDTVAVVHQDAESEYYHGQMLHATFFMSETWHRTPGGWRLMLMHESNVLRDPPAARLPASLLASYVGTYRAGPDLTYTISLANGVLVGARNGRPPVPLLAEVRDVFFVAGQPRTRKIFQRSAGGAVAGFVDRREGEDVVWKRT